MKLPRDLSGRELANALGKLGYVIDHQAGSHIRLTTRQPAEQPHHNPGSQPDQGRHAQQHFA